MRADRYTNASKKINSLGLWLVISLIVSVIVSFIYPPVAAIGLVIVGILFFSLITQEKEHKKEESQLSQRNIKQIHSSIKNYTPTQTVYLENYTSLLSIDENSKKICIIDKYNKPEIINFSDILQSELIADEVSVTKTSRGSQLGGALVGGILAGGVGAIIGGLSGSTETKQEVSKIKLQLVINDTSNPIREIYFLNKPYPIKKDKDEYIDAYDRANHWYRVMCVVIEQVDKEDEQVKIVNNPSSSVADELIKLNDLVKQGILSEEEFKAQKEKLLS